MTTVEDTRTKGKDPPASREVRDGMRIDWDVPIDDDGLVLRAIGSRSRMALSVILSYGPMPGPRLQDGYPSAWQRMARSIPT